MRIDPFDLDSTLGCGQVHRWWKDNDWWQGVIGERLVRLRQVDGEIEVKGRVEESELLRYFRADDDLDAIYDEISRDDVIPPLLERYRGMRLIRQDPWECAATYILATNANIPRIKKMIETVCQTFGHEIEDGAFSFPSPEELLTSSERSETCGLGYRCDRFIEFAKKVDAGEVDFDSLTDLPYGECISLLKTYKGIGDKVADCVALFSLEHLDAFPVDVRIRRALETRYGVLGPYREMRDFGRGHFGRYAGYAQQYLFIDESKG